MESAAILACLQTLRLGEQQQNLSRVLVLPAKAAQRAYPTRRERERDRPYCRTAVGASDPSKTPQKRGMISTHTSDFFETKPTAFLS